MGIFSTLGTIVGGFFGGPVGTKVGGAIGGAVDGGIASKQAAKANASSNQMDLGALRADAEANGFNPSSVLRLTGGGGYTQQPSGGGAFLSGALTGASAAIETSYQKKADAYDRAVQNELFGAQTANLNASTAAMGRAVMSTPSGHASVAPVRSRPALASDAPPKIDLQNDPFAGATAGHTGYDPAKNKMDWQGLPKEEQPRVRVQHLNGGWTSVPAGWAYAAKLTDGETMTAEHTEAWLAEVGSNSYSVTQAADMTAQTHLQGGTPMFPNENEGRFRYPSSVAPEGVPDALGVVPVRRPMQLAVAY